jgi:hypothetical protein
MANKRNILAVHRIRETRQKYGMSWCAYAHTLVMQNSAFRELNEIEKAMVSEGFSDYVG